MNGASDARSGCVIHLIAFLLVSALKMMLMIGGVFLFYYSQNEDDRFVELLMKTVGVIMTIGGFVWFFSTMHL